MRQIAAAIFASMCVIASAAGAAEPKIGAPAPDFVATTFDGKQLRLSDLKGQVVVLNLWATWCGPCRAELPLLDAYYRAYRTRNGPGLEVLALATQDSAAAYQMRGLAKATQIPFLLRFKGSAYQPLGGVPTNYIIDRAGVLRYAKAAAFNLDALNRELIPLLQEPVSAGPAPTVTKPAADAPLAALELTPPRSARGQ